MRPLIVLALLVGLLGMHGLLSDHHSGMTGTGTTGMATMAAHHPAHAAAAAAPDPDDAAPAVGTTTGAAAACCLAVLAVGLGLLVRGPGDGVRRPAPAAGPRRSPVDTTERIPRPPDLADLCVLRL